MNDKQDKKVIMDITEDVWDKTETDYRKKKHKQNIRCVGIKVFKVVKVWEENVVTNKYDFASTDYMTYTKKEIVKPTKYSLRKLDVRTIWWVNKELNQLANVELSERVWLRIVETRLQLKHHGMVVGDYIVYWKRNRTQTWIAFIRQEQLVDDLLPFLREFDYKNHEHYQEFKDMIAWSGHKTFTPWSKFNRWYMT